MPTNVTVDEKARPRLRCVHRRRWRPSPDAPYVELRFAEADGRHLCLGLEVGPPLIDRGREALVKAVLEDDLERAKEVAQALEDERESFDFDVFDENTPLRALTTADLRKINLSTLIQEALWQAVRRLSRLREKPGDEEGSALALPGWQERLAKSEAAAEGTRKRPGRPPRYDLQQVADVYRAHASGGAPTRAVARHFKTTKAAAAKLVARAREKGFLEAYMSEEAE